MNLSICLCTYRRPQLLEQLLLAVSQLDFGDYRAELVLVDNDPEASGLPVAHRWQDRLGIPLRALHEPVPNISQARNASVHHARGEFVLILDDDEQPVRDWARLLMQAQAAHSADVVFGPVLPTFHPETPDWIRDGGFFAPRSHPTGTRVGPHEGYTSNVLVRRSLALKLPGPFDPAFGRSGGEDVMVFHDLAKLGAVMIWCDEAAVTEYVPPSRTTLRWVLKRAHWGGEVLVRTRIQRLRGAPRTRLRLRMGVRAAVQLLVAALAALATSPFSRTRSRLWLRTAASQVGKLRIAAGGTSSDHAS